jgi:hypothetical protein
VLYASPMSQAQVALVQTPFIARAELWSGDAKANPSVGMFVAERLWNTLEATVVMAPREVGQTSGAILSLPWYIGGARRTCLLLSNASPSGTLEVWHVDPERNELRLSSGNFGKWDEFKRISALTRFGLGEGLPGRVWKTGCPVLLEDLSESRAFLRAEAARSLGLQCGLGLPVRYASGVGIVVLLSSRASPLGRSIDLWRLDETAELEHLQGLSFATSAREHAQALSVAQSLALGAAHEFAPAVFTPVSDPATLAAIHYGFAWPSRDELGVIHVATVVG